MRRPPDRKMLLAAMVLIVAAGVSLATPARGFVDSGKGVMGIFVQLLGPQGF